MGPWSLNGGVGVGVGSGSRKGIHRSQIAEEEKRDLRAEPGDGKLTTDITYKSHNA